jgi:hypothetical protein
MWVRKVVREAVPFYRKESGRSRGGADAGHSVAIFLGTFGIPIEVCLFMNFLSAERCPVCETRHVERLLQHCEYDGEAWFECHMCEHVFTMAPDAAPSENSEGNLDLFRLRAVGGRAMLGSA